MSVSIYLKGEYEEYYAVRRRKNKANQSQCYGKAKVKRQKVKMRVNLEFHRKGCLKKQTQFPASQNDVKSMLSMDYEKYRVWRRRKNKANLIVLSNTKGVEIGASEIAEKPRYYD